MKAIMGGLAALAMWAGAQAQEPASALPAAAAAPATLALANRPVLTFRATLLGDTPAERAALARVALDQALARPGPAAVSRTPAGEAVRFEIDGTPVFFLVPADLEGPRPAALLDAAAGQAEARLRTAIAETREIADPRRLASGAALALAATGAAWVAVRLLFVLSRRAAARLGERLAGSVLTHARHGARVALRLGTWALVLLLALAALGAVPGLLTAVLIFALARLATQANTLFMGRVERGELQVGWLDIDTAGPTRRLSNGAVWLFALAMAYPYLPGAGSEAFKGVTVLAGLMLSLGASGVVGQAMSGFSLMYARALRVGEYVKVGDTEGTVTSIGLFATQVHTGMGDQVSLPNAVVLSQPVRNFSRLAGGAQFMLQAQVTIGYATPWRQVHALLLEAAARTPGVAAEPAPYVVQTALSDFYVEYRLCAWGTKSAPRRRAEAISQLNANVQDVFNESGVQIMSPHYYADPPQPQVVPPGPWASKQA